MGIGQLLSAILNLLWGMGAHHAHHHLTAGNGVIYTRHVLLVVCRIPAHLHGATFRCSGWVTRP